MVENPRALKAILFDAYGGFADKRIKNLDRDALFIVDDRGPGDYDARNQLFLWFCQLLVRVESHEQVSLLMRGGIPQGPEVEEWFEAHASQHGSFGRETSIGRNNAPTLVI